MKNAVEKLNELKAQATAKAIGIYNDFVYTEMKQPDFKEVSAYAVKEYFDAQAPAKRQEVANAYKGIDTNQASIDDVITIISYYEAAREAYKNGGVDND